MTPQVEVDPSAFIRVTHGEILRVTEHATQQTTIEVNVLRYSDDPEVTSYPEPVTIPTRALFSPDVDPIFAVLGNIQTLRPAPAFVSQPTATLVAVAMSGTVDKAKGEGEVPMEGGHHQPGSKL
ncbi:MAG: hypothetical protein JW809_05520, partial [Pirellulales bacterium]|nr:hypothetical protein [Pirellulales bacterium]